MIEKVNSLQTLAGRINAEHARCESAARTALHHAINAGNLLIEAKAAVPHGGWSDWLAGNFAGSDRTARLYMRVADGAPRLEQNGNAVADLTLRQAARLLADEKPTRVIRSDPARSAGQAGYALHCIKQARDLLAAEQKLHRVHEQSFPEVPTDPYLALRWEHIKVCMTEASQAIKRIDPDEIDAPKLLAEVVKVASDCERISHEYSVDAETRLGQLLADICPEPAAAGQGSTLPNDSPLGRTAGSEAGSEAAQGNVARMASG